MTGKEPTGTRPRHVGRFTVYYLGTLIVGFTLATYLQYLSQYLDYAIPVIKGQAPFIWGAGITVGVALVPWLMAPWRRATGAWFQAFLIALAFGWLVRFALLHMHGDGYNYTTWLFPVVIAMVWLKAPDVSQARSALLVLGWTGSLLLVWTRLSELVGLIPMPQVGEGLLGFELQQYWLPLAGWLGPEGRWPGPLGGTAFTGMLGALLVVLAMSLRRKSSWFFAVVGVIAMLLTSSRGAFAAAAAGIGLVLVFSDAALTRRISFRWRLTAAIVGGLATLALLLKASPNLTGRTGFWPDFLDLWYSSPVTGVGASGYLTGTNWTITAGSAHSFFIDELSRNGLLGFAVLTATFVTALGLGLLAARRREGGPLAVIATVTVLGIANTPFSWLNPSLLWMFLVLPAVWAASVVNVDDSSDVSVTTSEVPT